MGGGMLLIGQWILFGIVILLGICLLWHAAQCLVRLVIVIAVAVLILLGLHRYSLLPEPVQTYVDELCSPERIQKAKDWLRRPFSSAEERAGEQNIEKNAEK
jgi:hypothetical protein